MSGLYPYLDRDVVVRDLSANNITWAKLRHATLGVTKAAPRRWRVCDSTSKWDVLVALLDCLLNQQSVLFVGPLYREYGSAVNSTPIPPADECGLAGFLTSGSTGKPKIVIHSSQALIDSAQAMVNARSLAGVRSHHLFPATYMAGVLNCMVLPLVAGGVICLDESFDLRTPFELGRRVQRLGSNFTWLSPRMVAIINRHSKSGELANSLRKNWRGAISATGPLQKKERDDFSSLLGIPLWNSYGTTEHMFITVESEPDSSQVSCGSSVEGVELRVGATTEDFSSHPGRVLVKSRTAARFVLDLGTKEPRRPSEESTQWLETGDIGYLKSGRLFIEGRGDDLVVVGGLNIMPRMIEEAVLALPDVRECAGFGYHSARGDVCLGLALEIDDNSDPKDVAHFARKILRTRLSQQAMPRFVLTSRRLPRTQTGKVDLVGLKRLAQQAEGNGGDTRP